MPTRKTSDLVHTIRAERPGLTSATGATFMVGGATAINIDSAQKVQDSLLPYLAVVVSLAFLLLFAASGPGSRLTNGGSANPGAWWPAVLCAAIACTALAGTAGHLVRSHPLRAEKILADLTSTTSSALRELKATVGLLRQADDPDAPLEPAPGLAWLPDLTAAFETAGLTVTVSTEGAQWSLSPARISWPGVSRGWGHPVYRGSAGHLAAGRDGRAVQPSVEADRSRTRPGTALAGEVSEAARTN